MSTLRTVRLATLFAIALALVVAGAAAGAAGQALILGQANAAGSSNTSLTTSSTGAALKVTQHGSGTALKAESDEGPPLALVGPTTKPPMTVNSSRRVTNLNADTLDNRTAADFMKSATYRQISGAVVPAGDVQSSSVTCDEGDLILSGGYFDKNSTTNAFDSYPIPPGSWHFFFVNAGAVGDSITIYALCSDFAPAHAAITTAEEPPRD